jgi:transposase
MSLVGIDVSKERLDCAAVARDSGKLLGKRSFANGGEGIRNLLSWMRRLPGAAEVGVLAVIEATASYHELAAHGLIAAGLDVSVVNPARVRSFASGIGILNKTDGVDAQVLAHYGRLANPKRWRPPASAVSELQALLSRLDDLEADLRREENRFEQAQARVCPETVSISFAESIRSLKTQRRTLERAIAAHLDASDMLRGDMRRLLTIPAVGPKTAARMLVLLRSRHFESARQAAAFLGLVPVERQSGKSVQGRPHLSKAGNSRLRAALYMAAVVATKLNPDVRAQQIRLLERGKTKMSALGAAMRKMVHLCFGVLKSGTDYRQPEIAKPA